MEKRCLLYGFGNIGRQDDGLGVILAQMLEEANNQQFDIDQNFQLNAEDALTISEYDYVVFADASVTAKAPFHFNRIYPAESISFSTHAMEPQGILALCSELYHKIPRAYLLSIPGYEWEFNAELSSKAEDNLASAFSFIQWWGTSLIDIPATDAVELNI